MKSLVTIFCCTLFIGAYQTLHAQDSADNATAFAINLQEDFTDTNSDIKEFNKNTDSVPDFQLKEERIKIVGTIFQSDGITPANNVTLSISQPDEDGYYSIQKDEDKRHIYHSASITTDADGKYTFYTFIPGTVHRSGHVKSIRPVIKEAGKEAYELHAFYFDNDPLLTKYRMKRLTKKGLDKSILKLEKKEDMFVANKDIILGKDLLDCK
ncbi:dioxygenase family protein [Lacinutrix sp. MEBiC02404]